MTPIRRVAIVSREYPPDTDWGGAGRYAFHLAEGLRDAGLDVHVIAQSKHGQYNHSVEEGLVVHRFPLVGINSAHPHTGQGLHDHLYLDLAVWAAAVADRFRRISRIHPFDVVEGSEYSAETLHLPVPSTTLRALRVFTPMAYVHELVGDEISPGVRIADQLEALSVEFADVVTAPSQAAIRMAGHVWGHPVGAHVIPLPFEATEDAVPPRSLGPHEPLRAVFFGRLERRKGPESAVWTAIEVARSGRPVELAMVGTDVSEGGESMRIDRLEPLVAAHHDLPLTVRFLGRISDERLAVERRRAHVALLPSTFESFCYTVCEALADGCHVITGDAVGVTEHLGPADGVFALPADDARVFAQQAARLVATSLDPGCVTNGQQRMRAVLSRKAVVAETLETWEDARERKLPASRGVRRASEPFSDLTGVRRDVRIAVIILAYNGLTYTTRCLDSLMRNPAPGMRIHVVDNASTDGTTQWLSGQPDPVKPVFSDTNLGVSGGRNAGILDVDLESVDAVVFLDNDTEVSPGWWEPFQAILDSHPEVGIVGEEGYHIELRDDHRHIVPARGEGPVMCDLVVGYCMYMRPEAILTTGLYDEELGLFWHDDDDYCLRAQLAGWKIAHAGTERVYHYGHVSSSGLDEIWVDASTQRASDLSTTNQQYLVDKWRLLGRPPAVDGVSGPFRLASVADHAQHDDDDDVATVVVDTAQVQRGEFPRDTTGAFQRCATRQQAGAFHITTPLTPSHVARLAFFAQRVVGDGETWSGLAGGAVAISSPSERGAARSARSGVRPWLARIVESP